MLAPRLDGLVDFVHGELSALGLDTIDAEDVIQAVATRREETRGQDQGETPFDIASHASLVRLGQLLDADYILLVTLVSFDGEAITTDFRGEVLEVHEYDLSGAYRLVRAQDGVTKTSGSVLATTRRPREAGNNPSRVLHGLIRDFSRQVGEELGEADVLTVVAEDDQDPDERVTFSVTCRVQDFAIPDVVLQKDGAYAVGSHQLGLQAGGVAIEVDGVVLGTAPASLQVRPGLHQIRVAREGFEPWEAMVNVFDGQALEIELVMTDAARARWMDDARFLESLQHRQALVDAEVEAVRGYAQMLRQSGYRFEYIEHTTIDADELPASVFVINDADVVVPAGVEVTEERGDEGRDDDDNDE